MSTHTCHATGCDEIVPPKMFMCRKHWFMLSGDMRSQVWFVYVPGQEIRKDPTPEYLEVANRAIAEVAAKEMAA